MLPCRAALTLLTLSLPWLISSCSVNPATGTPNLVFMSETKELKLGQEMHEKILQSTPIYADESLNQYVDQVGQKIAAISHRPDLTFTFTIVDSPDINAFALPGGFVYINRGLISYLDSEAQLAAVLAHEVGHITGRHAVKQDAAQKGSGVMTVLSVLATGSTVVGDVTDLWGTAAVRGYGREMELEADSLGAQYLSKAGYPTNAMIEVITVLKDHERFSRWLARESGKQPTSYHGVFSTHPRNDTRLQEVIAEASTLTSDQPTDEGRQTFRQHTEGLIYGINYNAKTAAQSDKNTFNHNGLRFSVDFPENWIIDNQRNQIVAKPSDDAAQIQITVARLAKPIAPDEYLREQLKLTTLRQAESFAQYGMPGHMGLTVGEEETPSKRVAVIYQGNRAYLIQGSAKEAMDPQTDQQFVQTIRSFRPLANARRRNASNRELHYVRANQHTTFKRLAEHVNLGQYTEQQLRVINGYYPRGEPTPGEWIKIVR